VGAVPDHVEGGLDVVERDVGAADGLRVEVQVEELLPGTVELVTSVAAERVGHRPSTSRAFAAMSAGRRPCSHGWSCRS